ncbi:iminophenyl-pyruvate dimer synthase VioB [Chromobacterium sphagni]|uniref:Iminophenyl-pyruvate dimer synthase VioB n=1 Tax=Chromobacterium sphagni TaxID=1903179 RepID=A0ABX3C851_9NEIS|nr:iminophenyl-pyruvate dimer synthase VioB [Chromobacterium sphagni]OHX17055.1 iminophenyl-pyruvate dimer synthase VioB [Chromobacterium sphagni]
MSILDFPRLHFRGFARVNAPTANRNVQGHIDMASNTVLMDGRPFDLSRPPAEFHRHLHQSGPRFDREGRPADDGVFSLASGYNACGNNHFSWENAVVTHVQPTAGGHDEHDGLVGARLALWGHYNEYLRTTFNRARWVDNDPTRPDATQIYAGQLTLSPRGATAHAPHLFTADIAQAHGARWVRGGHVCERSGHFLDDEFALARVFQFSLSKKDPYFLFNLQGLDSAALRQMQQALEDEDVLGLTVQYALFNMSTPPQPDSPVFHDLVGVAGLWRRKELASYPAGRLLQSAAPGLGPLTLKIHAGQVSLNMCTAIPFTTREEGPAPGRPTHALGGKLPLGDLLLKDRAGTVVARVPQALYLDYWRNHGILDVPLLGAPSGSLALESAMARWEEVDWVSQSDANNLYLEAPDRARQRFFPERITVKSYYRGEHRPRPAIPFQITGGGQASVETRQRDGDMEWLVTGQQPGIARIVLDHGAQTINLRVLPDDWQLDEVPAEQVDYAFLYRNVMAYYELIYPFMSDKVFSLADRCKCDTYARLMWQMCDPQNRDKSYYMPSTRELSRPKAGLFLKYLANVEGATRLLAPAPQQPARIENKAQLVAALKKAVDLELSIMLQYVYAAYSIPNYAQGQDMVQAGQWSQAQLELACGGGERRRDSGIRGAILEVAHEEMIHYLLVNNLLMALGEPFHPGEALFGQQAQQAFGLDTELSFEPFSEYVLARFIKLEWPGFIPAPAKSISAFYASILQALEELPGLFGDAGGKQGGEHHLFLNELTNRAFPAYQLEVSDRDSALFAIRFVTEQGEGGAVDSPHFEHSHFQRLRSLAGRLMAQPVPFEPALPVLKNPVLEAVAGGNLVTDARARAVMKLYQSGYELMQAMMAQHFAVRPLGSLRRSRLMNAAIDMMTGLLRPLSTALMNMPSGVPGRNAAPPVPRSFECRVFDDYSLGCQMLAKRCRALIDYTAGLEADWVAVPQRELLDFYYQHLMDLACGKLTREA